MTSDSTATPSGPIVPSPRALLRRYFVDLQMDNWSSKTIARRTYSLGRFLDWTAERGVTCVTELTPEHIEAYRRSLFYHRNRRTGQPIKFATQASYLSAMKHFLGWLVEQRWIDANPAQNLRLPKDERRLPAAYMTLAEVEAVIAGVDLSTPAGLRDRALLETFYATGIRRTELTRLNLEDLNRDLLTLVIRQGKGRKDRVVPIGTRTLQWIDRYLQDGRPHLVDPQKVESIYCLFLTTLGNRFRPEVLSALVRRYLTAAGITRRGSCHMLRHTAATLMLAGGADLRSIQMLLGHESLNTTQIYTHITIDRLRQVHAATHPGATERSVPNTTERPDPTTTDPTTTDPTGTDRPDPTITECPDPRTTDRPDPHDPPHPT